MFHLLAFVLALVFLTREPGVAFASLVYPECDGKDALSILSSDCFVTLNLQS